MTKIVIKKKRTEGEGEGGREREWEGGRKEGRKERRKEGRKEFLCLIWLRRDIRTKSLSFIFRAYSLKQLFSK